MAQLIQNRNDLYLAVESKNKVLNPKSISTSDVQKEGFANALSLFHEAAERVPAYKDFLRKNNINPNSIKTIEDFKQIPIINKTNYLRAYPLNELCLDGKMDDMYMLSSSSGSTGEPFLWPRGENQDLEGSLTHENIFKNIFNIDKHKTLFIVCFAMGTWISGPFSLTCATNLSKKGYKITTITPGIEAETIFTLFKKLAPYYDQIIISGYPPFIKDLLDLGPTQNINWKQHNVKFLFAAEGFSETWRDYVHSKVGSKDPLNTSVNIYGSADAAVLAHETPLTTSIRRAIGKNKNKITELFGEQRIPTLAQYDPQLKFFEEVDNSLIFTTRSGIPLVRYSIGDNGGIYTYKSMFSALEKAGVDKTKIMDQLGKNIKNWQMPFVYVFGRSDFTVTLYGLLIYPEHIKFGLERTSLQKYITGKFVMSIEYDKNQNQYLLIRVELAKAIKATNLIKKFVKTSVIDGLKHVNSEYNRLHRSINGKSAPVIELVENGNSQFFKSGAKQRWVTK